MGLEEKTTGCSKSLVKPNGTLTLSHPGPQNTLHVGGQYVCHEPVSLPRRLCPTLLKATASFHELPRQEARRFVVEEREKISPRIS
jgi:hypothetical protein